MIQSVLFEKPESHEIETGARAAIVIHYGNLNRVIVPLNRTPAVQIANGVQFGDQTIKVTPENVQVMTPGMEFYGTWNDKAVFAQLQNVIAKATLFNNLHSSSGLRRANAERVDFGRWGQGGRKKTRKTKKKTTV